MFVGVIGSFGVIVVVVIVFALFAAFDDARRARQEWEWERAQMPRRSLSRSAVVTLPDPVEHVGPARPMDRSR